MPGLCEVRAQGKYVGNPKPALSGWLHIVGVVRVFDAGSDTIDVWPLYGLATYWEQFFPFS